MSQKHIRLIPLLVFLAVLFLPIVSIAQIFPGNESAPVRFLIKPFGSGGATEVPPEVTDGKNIYVPGRVVQNGCQEFRGWVDDTKKVCICLQELTSALWVETDCNGQFDPPPGGTEVLGLGGGGGGGNQSLGSAATFGRDIVDSVDVSTAIKIGGVSDHWLFYFDSSSGNPTSGKVVQEAVCAGGDCNFTDDGIPPSGSYRIVDSSGAEVFRINDSGVLFHEFDRVIDNPSGGWVVDGDNCTVPAEVPLDGEEYFYSQCLTKASTGTIIYKGMLDGSAKTGSNIRAFLVGASKNASPSNSFDMEVSAKCENSSGGSQTTYGTPQVVTLNFAGSAQYAWERDDVLVTPNGTCQAYSLFSIKYQMATGAGQNNAVLADVLLFGQMFQFEASQLSAN